MAVRDLDRPPLHVCHTVLFLDVGGLERVVLDLTREGRARGHRVTILCVERPGALAPVAEATGVRVVCAGKSPGFRPDVVPHIANLLRRLRPDVVHTHQIGALLYAGPAARRARVPVVVHTEHGKHYAARWRKRIVGRMAARYAHRYFCVSDDIRREVCDFRIVPSTKAEVVHNGIDLAPFEGLPDVVTARRDLGLPADAFIVGTVGRLAAVKRQDVLLRGFARLVANRPSSHLLIVGEGANRAGLESLSAALGISSKVTFAGYASRPERFLAAMDVFALTSDSEGMPLSILEAWAAGKPVVASRVGGVPELIEDGRNGLLVPAGDDVALADRLLRLMDDRALARKLGATGRVRVREEFDSRVMADAYEQRYRELMIDRPRLTPVGSGR